MNQESYERNRMDPVAVIFVIAILIVVAIAWRVWGPER